MTLKKLHKNYKQCINEEVSKHLKDGTVPDDELCLNEKKEFYNHLHQEKKIEHDNIMRYYNKLINNLRTYDS